MFIDEIVNSIPKIFSKHPIQFKEEIILSLRETVKIKIQNVSDYLSGLPVNKQMNTLQELPCCSAPWKAFYMEYTVGSVKCGAMCYPLNRNDGERFQNRVAQDRINMDERIYWILDILLFFTVKPGNGVIIPVISHAVLDVYGKIICWRINKTKISMLLTRVIGDENNSGEQLEFLLRPIFMALNFANCKNVSIKNNPIGGPLQKKRKRFGKVPILKWHTLEIKPMTKILNQTMSDHNTGIQQALHICRGHFKDYRETGLFGKQKGLYWWDMHVRGNEKKGIVLKDYDVKAS